MTTPYTPTRLQDFNIMLLRTLFTNGTYVHWRNFTSLWLFLNGKAEQRGLRMERLPSSTFGVPGCRGSWLMSLGPELLQGAPPAKASCVMLFLHGGLVGCCWCVCCEQK